MTRRERLAPAPLDEAELAQLRVLTYKAFDRRGKPDYRQALLALELWFAETLAERLKRAREAAR